VAVSQVEKPFLIYRTAFHEDICIADIVRVSKTTSNLIDELNSPILAALSWKEKPVGGGKTVGYLIY
jgi:hypothetical protein